MQLSARCIGSLLRGHRGAADLRSTYQQRRGNIGQGADDQRQPIISAGSL
jgi:hypothetical protein